MFDSCWTQDTNLPLRFDFYLPEQNILIEYDGQGHFKKVNYSGKMSDREMQQRLNRTQQLDEIKNTWAKKNNIKLVRIPYWEYKNIPTIVKGLL